MMLSARAICALEGDAKAWFLAGLFGLSAAALQIRPLLVPNPGRGSSVYSPALAFFIAGLYLIPAGPLVACIAFAIALAGIVKGTRPHKILLQLSATVLAFGACSYFMKLGPRSGDPPVPPPELIAVEIFLGVVVLFAQRVFFQRDIWAKLVQNGMAVDSSWDRSAVAYEDVYKRAREVRGLPW